MTKFGINIPPLLFGDVFPLAEIAGTGYFEKKIPSFPSRVLSPHGLEGEVRRMINPNLGNQ
jgi:hypothetical protein